ncbi:hypothetical protein [Hirschia baltica]|uniref:Uncharacterized protein n=1 Tax=Hirschia baltica (strain ATCC 49814 / DSM 5838 / IFAM 1418) TaxID=582402 RepID=C6XR27_HIRBI|nr:hypothetical protein [Hirschia baltica]ACT60558.1 conserved hypothetical protein [Hirschia baltica ATCC 49814]
MSNDIFVCFECGQRNRVGSGSNRSMAKCGKCSGLLFPEEANSAPSKKKGQSAAPNGDTIRSPDNASDRRTNGVVLSLIPLILIVGGIGWAVFSDTDSKKTSSNVERTQDNLATSRQVTPAQAATEHQQDIFKPLPADLPPPVKQAVGVMWNRTGREAIAPLELVTSRGADYYIKLADTVTDRDAMAIFVRGGQLIEVEVPLGSYHLKYASGAVWRGEEALFGPDELTTYSVAGKSMDFKMTGDYVSGYTIELILQRDGNLATRRLAAEDF